eukprot:CAMPEP_0119323374 /NCGR_PEP_ID=MMETSP1333-20130426/60552_1 /TAXON_ID=418940 /ORGANISM="Scyphosphaera apsteinii, Strain RCC1455" /LENGTH=136 /DNA_ID=CAMNT_0007330801 /DNA_START=234 /DNA_END=645 /DNA_ORIENTATION=+
MSRYICAYLMPCSLPEACLPACSNNVERNGGCDHHEDVYDVGIFQARFDLGDHESENDAEEKGHHIEYVDEPHQFFWDRDPTLGGEAQHEEKPGHRNPCSLDDAKKENGGRAAFRVRKLRAEQVVPEGRQSGVAAT